MIDIEDAFRLLEQATPPPAPAVRLPLLQALGAALAEPLLSPLDLPPFRQAAVDGYACRLDAAKPAGPYRVIGEVQAGLAHAGALRPGEAVRIFTGAPVPPDAQAVAMQEWATREGEQCWFDRALREGEHIRPVGEQASAGEAVAPAGTRLGAGMVGMLAALGLETALVHPLPATALLTTGNELVPPGQPLRPGEMYESNALMLQAALAGQGFPCAGRWHVADRLEATMQAMEQAWEGAEVLVATGGVSVGDYDFVGKALALLGAETVFHKVRQKPGKPLLLARRGGKLAFGLPGNPAAALTCFHAYVLPALRAMAGFPPPHRPWVQARLEAPYHPQGPRDLLLKAQWDGHSVRLLGFQSSAMLRAFAGGNAFAYFKAGSGPFAAGDAVRVLPMAHPGH